MAPDNPDDESRHENEPGVVFELSVCECGIFLDPDEEPLMIEGEAVCHQCHADRIRHREDD